MVTRLFQCILWQVRALKGLFKDHDVIATLDVLSNDSSENRLFKPLVILCGVVPINAPADSTRPADGILFVDCPVHSPSDSVIGYIVFLVIDQYE
jgi:hypothetical protein